MPDFCGGSRPRLRRSSDCRRDACHHKECSRIMRTTAEHARARSRSIQQTKFYQVVRYRASDSEMKFSAARERSIWRKQAEEDRLSPLRHFLPGWQRSRARFCSRASWSILSAWPAPISWRETGTHRPQVLPPAQPRRARSDLKSSARPKS